MSLINPYTYQLVFEERSRPVAGSTPSYRPFLADQDAELVGVTLQEQGRWADFFSPEQTALALAQVTAEHVIPSLLTLDSGSDLLAYQVRLRDRLSSYIVAELVAALDSCGDDLHWDRVDNTSYACVIGAGVAACLDTTPGQEMLYLRYANTLAAKLYSAHHAAELPRSRLFLQTALYERFDALLTLARARCWNWLTK